MARPRKRCKFLAGAPVSTSLLWREVAQISGYEPAFRRYLGESIPETMTDTAASFDAYPKWRSLPLENHALRSEISQNNMHDLGIGDMGHLSATEDGEETTFMSLNSSTMLRKPDSFVESAAENEDVVTQFLEQTFAMHDNLQSSQIVEAARPSAADDTTDYLHRISPQTMTVDLVVGIISVAPARTVNVRKGGFEMDIVEMLVGDETKAGFSISFWLSAAESQRITRSRHKDDLRDSLRKLRPQDLVLVRGVALASFRGRVFGQSLSRRITKNETTIELLFRTAFDAEDKTGLFEKQGLEGHETGNTLIDKASKVKNWVIRFVTPAVGRRPPDAGDVERGHVTGRRGRTRLAVGEEELPPDTP
ncbi:hypothetical protein BJ546DRAFT_604460 [Cryomyces antarcticus]